MGGWVGEEEEGMEGERGGLSREEAALGALRWEGEEGVEGSVTGRGA